MSRNKVTAFLSALAGLVALWLGLATKPQVVPSPTPSPTVSISPSPLPSAFPTPSTAATPIISPTPVSTVFPQCVLPESAGKCENNPSTVGIFSSTVYSAQQKVADGGGFVDSQGMVVNEGEYTQEVARQLRLIGYCSNSKLSDEVWVKTTNDFSEHYDLVQGSGAVWLHFAARCAPAGF